MTANPADAVAAARALEATYDAALELERAFMATLSAALSEMHATADAHLATLRTLRGEVFPCGAPWPYRADEQALHLDVCGHARCAELGRRLLGMVEAA